MGEHFVLLVDRLITEASLEAAIESRRSSKLLMTSANENVAMIDCSETGLLSPRKTVECRICQEEDLDSAMETPCSCCGTLKYAHRRCIQRWCNEKGNINCEICHQQFKPDYTAPPPILLFEGIPMDLRENYEDYSSSTSRSLTCCRSVAVAFMVLLLLRHTLPSIVKGTEFISFPFFMLMLLRISGYILSIYVVLKGVKSAHRCLQGGANT